ncbi:hypothetical protein J6590_033679 [Homalodisca vitripennis]|nr:hypothetical protein J6590_033679 [Homalodisca vitripennis]
MCRKQRYHIKVTTNTYSGVTFVLLYTKIDRAARQGEGKSSGCAPLSKSTYASCSRLYIPPASLPRPIETSAFSNINTSFETSKMDHEFPLMQVRGNDGRAPISRPHNKVLAQVGQVYVVTRMSCDWGCLLGRTGVRCRQHVVSHVTTLLTNPKVSLQVQISGIMQSSTSIVQSQTSVSAFNNYRTEK